MYTTAVLYSIYSWNNSQHPQEEQWPPSKFTARLPNSQDAKISDLPNQYP